MATKKADTVTETQETFFAFPPIYSKLLHLANQDSNHEAADGPLYQVNEYCLGDPNPRGRRYPRQNPGVRPANIDEPGAYAENAIRFPYGFMFKKNALVSRSMILGNNWDTSESGRAYLTQLIADEKVVEVGRVSSRGEWVDIMLTGSGVDAVFGVIGFARSRVVRKADGAGSAPLVDCPLYILTRDSYFGGCRPASAPAGSLLPACVLNDPSMIPEAAMLAGTIDAQGWPTLTGPALEYMRGAAIIEADRQHRNTMQMTPDQSDWLASKLAACAVVEVAAVE